MGTTITTVVSQSVGASRTIDSEGWAADLLLPRHGKYYAGHTCQRLPDAGWLISLDAQDARGRTPVSKVVPHSEIWRITVGSGGLDTDPMPSSKRMPSMVKFPSVSKIDTFVSPASNMLASARRTCDKIFQDGVAKGTGSKLSCASDWVLPRLLDSVHLRTAILSK